MAENWCKEHQTAWFKKGKMKGFAHPILNEDGNPTGEWCNRPEDAKPEVKTKEVQMSREDWAEKDRITRKSIERQKALEMAVQVSQLFKLDTPRKITDLAKIFESYLEGEPGKTKLREEIDKLGAKEIEPEDIPY